MIKKINNSHLLKAVFIGYFAFLLLSCFFVSPFRDTFYYWEWSRHLSLSYYDGPPLIAYGIKLFTLLFGNSLFALNFLGVVCVTLTSWAIYKIVELLADKKVASLAAALYFTAPFVNQELLSRVTYDNLLNLFWFLSFYFVIRYISFQKTSDIYKFGIAAGLMLLSKYDGVVLLLALLIYFLYSKQQRAIFSNKHFYLAMLIVVLVFSPVLIWNAQHNWLSFKYQMAIHRLGVLGYFKGVVVYLPQPTTLSEHIANVFKFLWAIVLNFNVILLAALVALFKKAPPSIEARCIKWASLCFVVYWASISAVSNIAANYIMPLFGMLLIVAVFYLQRKPKISAFIVAVFLVIDIAMIVSHIQGAPFNHRQDNYIVAKQASLLLENSPQPVITPHYVAAEQIAYWLKGKPQIYALSCGLDANQYQFWQEDFMNKLIQHQIKRALFLDYMDEPYCIQPYFKRCTQLPTISYKHSTLYVYQCEN
ncbi:MAG: dolichol monophosphate mannose synthase [Gammaproteobacteria bacterium]|jgi:4-amino-4-deoxy-L-arabinose transferase-like glycosyltransferase|nr:dolichol monophosphate mannose synthase [Gammaproteobacteria bacterium]